MKYVCSEWIVSVRAAAEEFLFFTFVFSINLQYIVEKRLRQQLNKKKGVLTFGGIQYAGFATLVVFACRFSGCELEVVGVLVVNFHSLHKHGLVE